MARRTITVVVTAARRSADGAPAQHFLTPAGKWSLERKDAAVIKLYAGTTPRERMAVEDLCAQWSTSRDAWLEQVAGVALLTRRAQQAMLDQVFPDGRPELTSAEEEHAYNETLERAWATFAHPVKEAALTLQERVEQLRFFARWKTCQVEVPPGWEDIGGSDLLGEEEVMALWAAVMRATDEATAGNA